MKYANHRSDNEEVMALSRESCCSYWHAGPYLVMSLRQTWVYSLEELRRRSEVLGSVSTLSADVTWPFRAREYDHQRDYEGMQPLQQKEKMLRTELEEVRRLRGPFY